MGVLEDTLKFIFNDNKLEKLYTNDSGPYKKKYSEAIINKFFDVLGILDAVPNEQYLYRFKGLHYEDLKGPRKGTKSMRLNDQWRIVVQLAEENDDDPYFIVLGIEDYH